MCARRGTTRALLPFDPRAKIVKREHAPDDTANLTVKTPVEVATVRWKRWLPLTARST